MWYAWEKWDTSVWLYPRAQALPKCWYLSTRLCRTQQHSSMEIYYNGTVWKNADTSLGLSSAQGWPLFNTVMHFQFLYKTLNFLSSSATNGCFSRTTLLHGVSGVCVYVHIFVVYNCRLWRQLKQSSLRNRGECLLRQTGQFCRPQTTRVFRKLRLITWW